MVNLPSSEFVAVRSAILKLAGLHGLHGDAIRMRESVGMGDVILPEPVPSPDEVHLLDGNALGLGDEKICEQEHDHHPSSEEEEDAPLECAQH